MFAIRVNVYSEKEFGGNCSTYYVGVRNCLTGIDNKKVFDSSIKADNVKRTMEKKLAENNKWCLERGLGEGSFKIDMVMV